MGFKSQAQNAGLGRSESINLADGESIVAVVNLSGEAKLLASHAYGPAKIHCKGEACPLCLAGIPARKLWKVDFHREDQDTGELTLACAFMGDFDYADFCDVLPAAGLNCRVIMTGRTAVGDDGQPILIKKGKRAGQPCVNLEFQLKK